MLLVWMALREKGKLAFIQLRMKSIEPSRNKDSSTSVSHIFFKLLVIRC